MSNEWLTTGQMKTCSHCGRNKGRITFSKKFGGNLCKRHSEQYYKHGYFLDSNSRTAQDENEIVKHDDYTEMFLYDRKGNKIDSTLIDNEDIEKVIKHRWHLHKTGYVCSNYKGKIIRLHRLLTDCPDDKMVDHINHNKRDNRKYNLRICTNAENARNRQLRTGNKTGYTGVIKIQGGWQASIGINGENKYLGYFRTKEDAIKARKKAEEKFFGEFKPASGD